MVSTVGTVNQSVTNSSFLSTQTSSSSLLRRALVPIPGSYRRWLQSQNTKKNRQRKWCQMLQLENNYQVLLGSWERGQEYTNDIIENLNHWSTGWTDWNLVLDMNGGDRFDFGSLAILQTMDITMMLTQVQIGQIISWTRQSLSTATLTSSTSSRCTTPLLTSGGDSFERFFLNIFHQQVPPRGLVQSGTHSRGIRC